MTTANDNASFEALTFGLQGEIFALDANCVREILDVIQITQVPGADQFVGGLINVRGRVMPLADLRVKFGMDRPPNGDDSRIIVIEIDLNDTPHLVGLLADKVFEVTEIRDSSIEETPDLGMKWHPEFIKGIGKRGKDFIIIPNFDRIFAA